MSYQAFKQVDIGNPGSTFQYGANDLLEWFKILNGLTVSNKRPHIANRWLWEGPQEFAPLLSDPAAPTTTNHLILYNHPTTHRLRMFTI